MSHTTSKSSSSTKRLVMPVLLLLLVATVSTLLFYWIANPGFSRETDPTGISQLSSIDAIHKAVNQTYGKMEMSFESNQGQTDGSVDFLARGIGYTLFLRPEEAVMELAGKKLDGKAAGGSDAKYGPDDDSVTEEPSVLRLQFVGANSSATVAGTHELSAKSNYFIGNDPDKWRTNVSNYGRVRYDGVYEGIDLEYYGNQRQLEYDFHVAPGADYRQIAMNFAGADSLGIDGETGDLLIGIGGKMVRQHKPIIYQSVDGERREIEGRFEIDGQQQVGFEIGEYDSTKSLVIDPVLVYSTYFGTLGVEAPNDIAVDSEGNAYVIGGTNSTSFPTTNPFQAGYGGGDFDAFVVKINASGSAVVYSTYLGGNNYDGGFAVAVDQTGSVYVTGRTVSETFPIVNAIQSVYSGFVDGDAFITKINPSGSALIYSTYLGGDRREVGTSIAVDPSGNAYVAGMTGSDNFPTVSAMQTTFGGGSTDTFLAKINPSGSALVYSTYLGGDQDDNGDGIAVDSTGSVYVAGVTSSSNFPTASPIQTAVTAFGNDIFLSKISPSGTGLVYSTYLGGSNTDGATALALDSSNNVYLTGYTFSSNFPTVGAIQSTLGGLRDAFVMKVNSTGSALIYSSYIGGSGLNDGGFGIAVDTAGSAYVVGGTSSADLPTVNAIQGTFGGGNTDGFLAKINPDGSAFTYLTYLGGSGRDDEAYAVAVDQAGNAYATGRTNSPNFPIANPIRNYSGALDVFITKITDGPLPTPTPGASPIPTPTPPPAPSPTPVGIVISQIYGGGGLPGATYRNSFIELFNRGNTTASLPALTFSLAQGTQDFNSSFVSSRGVTLQPGQYALIEMGSSGSNGALLPQADHGFSPLGNSSFGFTGKIMLTKPEGNPLSGPCPFPNDRIVDLVGFGPTNCFAGSGSTGVLSQTSAAVRRNSGCAQTDDNAADFMIAAPNPRNSSSPRTPCSGQVAATPTPTPPSTPTPTPTPSPTPTPTPSPTLTPTPTPTPTPSPDPACCQVEMHYTTLRSGPPVYHPEDDTYDIPITGDFENTCRMTNIDHQYSFYLYGTVDGGFNWDFIARTPLEDLHVDPLSTKTINGAFDRVKIPSQYKDYLIRYRFFSDCSVYQWVGPRSWPTNNSGIAPTPTPLAPAVCGERLSDPGFELNTARTENAFWQSRSELWGSGLCTTSAPNVCPFWSSPPPRTGNGWVRFDGAGNRTMGSFVAPGTRPDIVSQSFRLTAGFPATLTYYMRTAVASLPHNSTLTVRIDNTVIETVSEPQAAEPDYSIRTVAIPSQFADGSAHTLSFSYVRPPGISGDLIAIDDVSLVSACTLPTPTPTPTPSPTPAPSLLTISGRTVTEAGAGIRNQVVTLTRDDGAIQTSTTSSFGVFLFSGLQPGRTYTIGVRSKRYRFAPRVIELTTNVTDIPMIALE